MGVPSNNNRISSLVSNFSSIFGLTRLNVMTYVKLCDNKIHNSFKYLIDLEKWFKHNKILNTINKLCLKLVP